MANNNDILKKYGITLPEFTGVAGSGANRLYSMNGKWYHSGQTTPEGYKIGDFNEKNNTVNMNVHGIDIPHQMNGSFVYDSNKLQTSGAESSFDKNIMHAYNNDPTSNLPDLKDKLPSVNEYAPHFMIDDIRNKAIQSGVISKENQDSFVSHEDFMNKLKTNTAEKGKTYYIPTSGGDIHKFMSTPEPDSQ